MVKKTLSAATAACLVVLLPASPSAASGEQRTTPRTCVTTAKSTVCLATETARDAYQALLDRSWGAGAQKVGYAFSPDGGGTRVRVMLDASADPAAADRLQRALGEVVVVERTGLTAFSGSRTNDASPHYGGAAVGFSSIPTCTTGFSVRFPDGTRGSVTASHCFNSDEALLSGSQFYGVVRQIEGFPSFDVVAVDNAGTAETYTNVLHVDPCCPSARSVIGDADPVKNAKVCASGRVTLAKCNINVDETATSFCPPEFPGCVPDVMQLSKTVGGSKVVIGAKGDSGGVVYTQSGATGAVVNGMVIGGSADGKTVFAEKVSNITAHVGATVLTTP
ncbi:hypothetical protein [Saccharothrix coeruleofusca]|uniref:Streptogrisin C n=1 Tax=Saccharothrix coeruleofusca TaxID=33919 RepID=A0A918EG42_9PSEU|nr:hypothetical protein [Saccharothrix coeruleofusca]GGP78320.1 hypothetical protein GCM10010185_60070 [Saccharothrix coeruleofusca]